MTTPIKRAGQRQNHDRTPASHIWRQNIKFSGLTPLGHFAKWCATLDVRSRKRPAQRCAIAYPRHARKAGPVKTKTAHPGRKNMPQVLIEGASHEVR